MQIKRSELFRVKELLESMPKAEKFKFNYAAAKNLRMVKSEIEDMQKTIEADGKMIEYEKARVELCQKYAKKENGNPVIIRGAFQIEEDKMDEFNVEIEELKKAYSSTLELHRKRVDGYNVAMTEMVDINFHKVRLEDMPADLKPGDLEMILDWIIEEESKAEANA